MKKMALFGLAALLLAAGVFLAQPVAAHGPCDDVNEDGMPSGMEYGLYHISSHTPHGPADEHHNPGTHMGYSLCLEE